MHFIANLSNIFVRWVKILFHLVSSSHIVHTPPTEAWATLKAAGYFPRPLWDKIKPLQESSIDLSIIIPVYNAEEYLHLCLESILKQKTNFTYEVVCINDGSNNGSLSILEKFAEIYSCKLVVVSQLNAGISISRNRGIAMAKGKYIGFIDMTIMSMKTMWILL